MYQTASIVYELKSSTASYGNAKWVSYSGATSLIMAVGLSGFVCKALAAIQETSDEVYHVGDGYVCAYS